MPFWEEREAEEYDEQAVEAKRSETKNDVFDRRLNPLVGRGITRADRMRGVAIRTAARQKSSSIVRYSRECAGAEPEIVATIDKRRRFEEI